MSKGRFATVTVLALALLAFTNAFILPFQADLPHMFRLILGLALAAAILIAGSGVFFFIHIHTAKGHQLPKHILVSNLVLCLGMVLFGLSFLQIPFWIYTGQEELWHRGVLSLPFCLGLNIIYFATRSLTTGKKLAQRVWFMALSTLVLTGLLGFLPQEQGHSGWNFQINNFYTGWGTILMVLVSLNLWNIKSHIGVAYISRFAWLFLASVINTVTIGAASLILLATIGDQTSATLAYITLVPTVLSGLLFVRAALTTSQGAALADTQERTVARNFFGEPLQHDDTQTNTSVDIVIFAANLVSDPLQIDSLLDSVRTITAQRSLVGAALLPHDQEVLSGVYHQIEQYLVEKEPLGPFDRMALRQTIAQKLRLTVPSGTFWDQIVSEQTPQPDQVQPVKV